MTTLDSLTTFWIQWVMLPSFISVIIGFFFYAYSEFKESRKTTSLIGVSLLILSTSNLLVGFFLAWSLETLAKNELISLLDEPNIEIEINDEKLVSEYSNRVISELKNIKNLQGHHSNPTNEIELKISSKKDSMTLIIKQDSEKKFEFWVFSNRYNHTKNNIIGKLNTLVFIKYFSS